MTQASYQQLCFTVIVATILIALVVAWPYPDFIASAIGLIAGLAVGALTGGRSA